MEFAAPWGRFLKTVTLLSCALLVTLTVIGLSELRHAGPIMALSMAVLPLAVLIGSALFVIRGYRIEREQLLVPRLLWTTVVPLHDLETVQIEPAAMQRSLRTFGNGGLFSISGRFRNKMLGPYRAFATDPAKAVVLRLSSGTIVVTPDDPQGFASALRMLHPMPD